MLLSQVLVAFTVEFDNEFEHRLPHRTSAGRSAGAPADAPWLVSQVMWSNVLRFIDRDGTPVDTIHRRARTTSDSLVGLQRWGYVTIDPHPGRARGSRNRGDEVVKPTAAGRRAQAIWRPLSREIEQRWQGRFGVDAVTRLHRALEALSRQLDRALPRYLPVIHPTSNGKVAPVLTEPEPVQAVLPEVDASSELPELVSRVLVAFTLAFEAESRISLPISANTLRVLNPEGVRVRDLPGRTGVSKEANAMAVGFLERHGCVEVVSDPTASRGKVVRLTTKGQAAQAKYGRVLTITEERWRARYGSEALASLRRSLETVVGVQPAGPGSMLFRGMHPYPDGWRAGVRPPETIPHYPMVLHRGGYPDGA